MSSTLQAISDMLAPLPESIVQTLFHLGTGLLAVGMALIAREFYERLITKVLDKERKVEASYAERIDYLTKTLVNSTREVDAVFQEIGKVALERQFAAEKLQQELAALSQRESELKQRVEALKNVPLPVAEHFARLLETGEKKSAKRDYLLFWCGGCDKHTLCSGLKIAWFGLKGNVGLQSRTLYIALNLSAATWFFYSFLRFF
jgi:hypothetical protein